MNGMGNVHIALQKLQCLKNFQVFHYDTFITAYF